MVRIVPYPEVDLGTICQSSQFTAPMYMFSPLLVSVRCLKIWRGLSFLLFVEGLAEGVSGLRPLIG